MAYVPPLEIPRDEVCVELDRIRHPFRIAIDRAKNPFNIGSIVRTAHSFLVKEIFLIGSEPWYERAAMGMQRYEHIVELSNQAALIQLADREGWPVIAFEKDHAEVDLWNAEIPEDAVLIFGNEDDGCTPEILEAAQQVVAIPMFGINHSYPISVAAGIAMAEWARRYYAKDRTIAGSF